METITIFELNAMNAAVSHKLGGVLFNEKSITWQQWTDRCSDMEADTSVCYQLRPQDKALHIILKTLPANPFLA
ncbi:hypothetical protein CLV98_109173 [Dyadobacter jejuensis]|uniref:Uncharacterized protein n=1 Tax=Dyadobacter jejuensis TaxID=1082580 RepID=A0A316AH81_9BACT|nr:hypothetical protein [Dyadobacter jejuensis]PWJ57063.1 hypothetical protein CLV98_109173 [Dyadobacter jejuensis]